MIVAGIGARRGVAEADVVAAIDMALGKQILTYDALGCLATIPRKASEPGILEAARSLGLDLVVPDEDALKAVAGRAATRSAASLESTGLPSAAEAVALAAAGPDGRLILPRIVVGPVTCALAEGSP